MGIDVALSCVRNINVLLCQVNKHFAESDLLIYANVNYVSMDGGYKSYATGLVSCSALPCRSLSAGNHSR